MVRTPFLLGSGLAAALLVSGCGAQVEPGAQASEKVTVNRCGEPIAYTTPKRPSPTKAAAPTSCSPSA